mmetsp:Transcript_31058/g.28252  ORF Transcript_31058/g.28252 Transcript_31058/m.28252 type:complete len:419 (+) Transcript_31058:99-1355(+)
MQKEKLQSRSTTVNLFEEQEKVEIFVSCRKLKNMDYFSLTDPQIRLYIEKNGEYYFHDQTEKIQDNLNPNFTKSFVLDYHFEVKQKLKFSVIDIDGPNSEEFVGECFTSLGEIVGARNQTSIFNIEHKGKKNGKLVVQCEKVTINNSKAFFEIQGLNLKNVGGCFGSNNPFVRFYRTAGDSGWVSVHKTEVTKGTKNPIFKLFEIKTQKLCNGDYHRPIKATFYSQKGYKEKLIGECEFTIDQLVNSKQREFNLNNQGKPAGKMKIGKFDLREEPAFLDYIRGGLQLSVVAAIDFTGSNGVPTQPNSLHAIKYDGTLNEYQKALRGCLDILLNYDYDQKIPIFGFGGKPKFPQFSSNQTNHCFACTGDPSNPWVHGLDGIMQTYSHAISNVELAGPTLFAPLISEAMKLALTHKQKGS